MNGEIALEFIKLLAPFGAAAIIFGILAFQSPRIIKELFAGVGGLLLTIEKAKRGRKGNRPTARRDQKHAASRSDE